MNFKYKILIFAHDSSLYGASKSLLTLLEYWKFNNPEINVKVILPYKGKIEDFFIELDINYEVIDFPRCDYKEDKKSCMNFIRLYYQYLKKERKAIKYLNNIINDFTPNVIYVNTSVISIGYKLAKINNIPLVWHIREFGYQLEYFPNLYLHKHKIANSKAIFVSNILRTYWVGKNTKKSIVIYNGFNNQFNNQSSNKFNIIGILGAITRGKGQLVAVEAIKELVLKGVDVKLEIYGDVIDKDYYLEIKQFITQNNLSKYIEFCGFVNNQEYIYNRISVLYNCSLSEGFGRTIIEAMLNKIPVIANNKGAMPEIIEDGINGFIYEDSVNSLVEKTELVMKNKNIYKKIVEEAYYTSINNYKVDNYANSILDFIKNTINDKN